MNPTTTNYCDALNAAAELPGNIGRDTACTLKEINRRLTAFMRGPRMELTNNEVERDLRRWVLDRKTWYFVGHEVSARRAADALTLLTTCRKMGLDPRRYLRATLAKILGGEKDLLALLPETFARELAAEKLAAENASTERPAA